MSGGDGEPVEVAIAVAVVRAVDEVHATARPGVRAVGLIGVGHLPKAGVDVVVPGAPLRAEAAHTGICNPCLYIS